MTYWKNAALSLPQLKMHFGTTPLGVVCVVIREEWCTRGLAFSPSLAESIVTATDSRSDPV